MKNDYLPKISILFQIGRDILARLYSDDSIENLLVCLGAQLYMLMFCKKAFFIMHALSHISTNPAIRRIFANRSRGKRKKIIT